MYSPLSSRQLSAVWAAEEGRCEHCHRPMDRRMAFARPLRAPAFGDLDAFVLLCPWCFFTITPHWEALQATEAVLDAIVDGMLGTPSPDQALAFLHWAVGQHGVVVPHSHPIPFDPHHLRLWMPGVGCAVVDVDAAFEHPTINQTGPLHYYPNGWQLIVQPQGRSRHLPLPASRSLISSAS